MDDEINPGRHSLSNPLLIWLGGLFAIATAILILSITWETTTAGDEPQLGTVHVEEFRVAEPLTGSADTTLRAQLETITAVTEPFDEVEAAVEAEPEELAGSRAELEMQCVTVLKEMAFCTNEDSFLDIIGTASNLRTSGERERFMERVHHWFEPGGTQSDCARHLDADEAATGDDAKMMWQRSAVASELLCDDFGRVLLDAELFRNIGGFWEE